MNRGARASTIGVGIAFGFLITGSGFGNYTTIHQALLLICGAVIFGAGFALTGTCPGGAIAMIATGGLGGLVVLAGLVTGLWLRGSTERSAPGQHTQAAVRRHEQPLTGAQHRTALGPERATVSVASVAPGPLTSRFRSG